MPQPQTQWSDGERHASAAVVPEVSNGGIVTPVPRRWGNVQPVVFGHPLADLGEEQPGKPAASVGGTAAVADVDPLQSPMAAQAPLANARDQVPSVHGTGRTPTPQPIPVYATKYESSPPHGSSSVDPVPVQSLAQHHLAPADTGGAGSRMLHSGAAVPIRTAAQATGCSASDGGVSSLASAIHGSPTEGSTALSDDISFRGFTPASTPLLAGGSMVVSSSAQTSLKADDYSATPSPMFEVSPPSVLQRCGDTSAAASSIITLNDGRMAAVVPPHRQPPTFTPPQSEPTAGHTWAMPATTPASLSHATSPSLQAGANYSAGAENSGIAVVRPSPRSPAIDGQPQTSAYGSSPHRVSQPHRSAQGYMTYNTVAEAAPNASSSALAASQAPHGFSPASQHQMAAHQLIHPEAVHALEQPQAVMLLNHLLESVNNVTSLLAATSAADNHDSRRPASPGGASLNQPSPHRVSDALSPAPAHASAGGAPQQASPWPLDQRNDSILLETMAKVTCGAQPPHFRFVQHDNFLLRVGVSYVLPFSRTAVADQFQVRSL